MSGSAERRIALMFVALPALMAVADYCFAGSKITGIKVTQDLRRLVIQCDGEIPAYRLFPLEHPSRLVIEMPGIVLGESDRLLTREETGGLEIRVGETKSGTRVVADFGKTALPEHKIIKIGNSLLVMLADWTPEKYSPWSTSARASRSAQAVSDRNSEVLQRPSPVGPVATPGEDLIIKSAEVLNGVIVLKVSHRSNPNAVYQIRLDVDFGRLGFSAASVQSMSQRSQSPGSLSDQSLHATATRNAKTVSSDQHQLPHHLGNAPSSSREGTASLVFQSQARPSEGLNALRERYRSAVAARRSEPRHTLETNTQTALSPQ